MYQTDNVNIKLPHGTSWILYYPSTYCNKYEVHCEHTTEN